MQSQIIENGNVYFRDTITNKKVIKEINSDKEVTAITINTVDKDSDIAKNLINNLSNNVFVRINYNGDN